MLQVIAELLPPISALNPLERYEAARQLPSGSNDWLWVVLLSAVVVLVLGSVVLLVYGIRVRRKRDDRAFHAQTTRLGLTDEESGLLELISQYTRVKDPTAVFSADIVFWRGVAAFQASAGYAAMTPEHQAEMETAIEVLRQKLHYDAPTDWPAEAPAGASAPSERRLTTGSEVAVVHRGKTAGAQVRIIDVRADEIVVESDLPPGDVRPGEAWLLRYARDGSVWEFDATVVRAEQGRLVLSRPGRFRFIERRRYPRTPTDKPAKVAEFVGLKSIRDEELPEFVPGTVVEIAGPGLRIATGLTAAPGGNLLAVVKLGEDSMLEALGKVRRVARDADGAPTLCVELVGLTPDEMAELVRATNDAAREHRAAAGAGEPAPAQHGEVT